MQNGPFLCFLTEQELEALLSQNVSSVQVKFRDGVNRLGFVDLMRRKPCVTYLFRPSARSPLTQRKLIHVLKPVFSDIRFNRRLKEDVTYQKFIAYLREVSGTEKAKVTLDKILQFVTASAEILDLGYYKPPNIEFFL
ncbi:hypothetical protein ACJMK2_011967 [Sinanodonta woodiana]|uniref:LAGLIDADG homing endonuclease n=1 Tax=Sinanodonta woodiana TaxID=1069815 RepID=A0ABD3V719_SINWO